MITNKIQQKIQQKIQKITKYNKQKIQKNKIQYRKNTKK